MVAVQQPVVAVGQPVVAVQWPVDHSVEGRRVDSYGKSPLFQWLY